jgi:putative ABC transport system permease protein
MIANLFRQAYEALRHNRRRSVLTMLGMAWGIATVVLLLAYGAGFERGLWSAFRSFGTNLIFIFPGRTSMQAGGTKAGSEIRLTMKDFEHIEAEVAGGLQAVHRGLWNSQRELFRQWSVRGLRAHAAYGVRRWQRLQRGRRLHTYARRLHRRGPEAEAVFRTECHR